MKKGLAVFSGSAVVHKLMQDGTVVLGTSANPAVVTVSGNVNITGQLTASADKISVGVVAPLSSSVLDDIIVELYNKAGGDNSALSSSFSSSLAAEISRATSAESTLQTNLDNVSGALKTYVDSQDSALSGAFNTRVGSLETTVQAIIGDSVALNDITGTLNSIKEIAEYLDGDGQPAQLVADLSTEVSRISGALVQEATDRASADSALSSSFSSSLAAEITRATGAETTLQTNLNTVSGALKSYVDTQDGALSSSFSSSLAAEISRATSAEGTLQTNLNNVSGALKSYVDSQDSALSSSVSSSIAAVQTDLNNAQFTVNGLAVNAKGGSFTIVTGSSGNLSITNSGSVVTVDLNSSVTLAGTLAANVVSASAGLSVSGGATVAGGVTVSTGDLAVSHGTIKTVLDATADSTALTTLAGAAATSNGKFFYLVGTHASWARGDCWYFCQGGQWFDAPFFQE